MYLGGLYLWLSCAVMSPLVQQWSGLVWRQCSVMLDTSYKSQCTQQSAQSGHSGQGGCCEHLGAAAAPLSRYLHTGDERKVSSPRHAARPDQPRPGGEAGEGAAGGGQARAHRAAGGGQLPRRSPGAGCLLICSDVANWGSGERRLQSALIIEY